METSGTLNDQGNDFGDLLQEQIAQLENLLHNSPDDVELEFKLSQLYMHNLQLEEAKPLLQKTLDRARMENDAEIIAACMRSLGIMCLVEGDKIAAREWLSSALQIYEMLNSPKVVGEICHLLAITLWDDGEPMAVVNLLERAAYLVPNQVTIFDMLAKAYQRVGEVAGYHYARGRSLETAGDFGPAAAEFELSINAGLDESDMYRLYGICLSEVGRYPEAVHALTQSIELDPENANSHHDLGFVYQKLSMLHAAAREYERSCELAPGFVGPYLNLIGIYLQLGLTDQAQILVDTAMALSNTDPRVHWLCGRLNLMQFRLLDCHTAWLRAIELAEGPFKDMVQQDLQELERSIAPSTFEQRTTAIEEWLQLQSAKEENSSHAVIPTLEEICRKDPYFIETHMQLAKAYMETGEQARAQAVLEKILVSQPERQDIYLQLGEVLIESAQFTEAQEMLEKAVALNPRSAAGSDARRDLYVLKARTLYGELPSQRFKDAQKMLEEGNRAEAIAPLTEAVTLAPTAGLYHYELGWVYLLEGQLESAVRHFEIAVKAEPEEGTFYGGLGTALVMQNRLQDAAPALLKAVELDESDPESHNALGMLYLATDDHMLAENEFRLATELDPYRLAAWENLFRTLALQKKPGQIDRELKRLFDTAPDAGFHEQLEDWLGVLLGIKEKIAEHFDEHIVVPPAEASSRLSTKIIALIREGRAFEENGFIDTAAERYEMAVAEDFQAFHPHFLLGNMYARVNRHQEAIREYSFAVSGEASDEEIADAYYNMGNSFLELRDLDHAITSYRQAIEAFPNISDARQKIGLCQIAQGEHEDALQMIQEELQLQSSKGKTNLGHLHFYASQMLISLGRDTDALFETYKALASGFGIAPVRLDLGKRYLLEGLWNLAQLEFEKVLETEPDNDHARTAVDMIRFLEHDSYWQFPTIEPRLQHSLDWRRKQFPVIPGLGEVQYLYLGEGQYGRKRNTSARSDAPGTLN